MAMREVYDESRSRFRVSVIRRHQSTIELTVNRYDAMRLAVDGKLPPRLRVLVDDDGEGVVLVRLLHGTDENGLPFKTLPGGELRVTLGDRAIRTQFGRLRASVVETSRGQLDFTFRLEDQGGDEDEGGSGEGSQGEVPAGGQGEGEGGEVPAGGQGEDGEDSEVEVALGRRSC